MTRWARSKSILKHERQPGEATTWSEFVAQRQQPGKQQQQEGATKRGAAQGSSGTLVLTNAAGKLYEDNNAVSIKRKVARVNAAGVRTVDSDAACAEKTVTKLCAQVPQQSIRSKAPFKVKGKNVVKKTSDALDDKEAELLEAVLKQHSMMETDVPAVQKVTDVASQKIPATVPKQSMAAANAASHKGGIISKKNMKGRSSSLNSKTELPRRKNACAVESAEPTAENEPSVCSESEGHTGTKEMQSLAIVPKKKNAAAKRTVASAREDILPPDEKEEKVEKLSFKKTRSVNKKPLSKEAAAVPTGGRPLHTGGDDDDQPAPMQPRTGPRIGGSHKAEWLQRRRQEREAKGILLLPEKVERRIYLAKKAMRKKGLPGEQIKEAVRKMRRKEELLFRRQLAKLCFKCRQPGHKVSDCPQILQDSSEAVGICFKCGSTEHFSSACSVQTSKDNEFPYAKCFICKQQGHLSRKCPRNEKGAFPKGGHCNFCGAVDHFKKECPEMERNKKNNSNEESEIAADIASVDQSADAENIALTGQQSHGKRAKVVSF
uniref:Putative e3 ubiquitin ligase n=1 Tax=Amblyomma aureolatum TaxID=187763 RepID=A0A1E1XBZ6_9ACAR